MTNLPLPPALCVRWREQAVRYEVPRVRHLLYHIAPFKATDVWCWNLGELRRRIDLFNGRRVVGIVTGPDLLPPDAVEELLADCGCEYHVRENDPVLREVVTIAPLFGAVRTDAPDEVTFYGHAKGVSRPPWSHYQRWARICYEASLDYWPLVEQILQRFPCCGPFKRVGYGWTRTQSTSSWLFSGSFYWFRNREWFSKPRCLDPDRFFSGVESFPAKMFPCSMSAPIFDERYIVEGCPSNQRVFEDVECYYEGWREEQWRYRR